jgi:hypothetical protein
MERKPNIGCVCSVCKTKNHKWNKLFYASEGQILKEVSFMFISVCKVCNHKTIINVKTVGISFYSQIKF